MKTPVWFAITIAVFLLAAAVWKYGPSETVDANFGTYLYACGAENPTLKLTPSSDFNTIHIKQDPYFSSTDERLADVIPEEDLILDASASSTRYEGRYAVMYAFGETIELSNDTFSGTCHPVPNPNEPPLNFGD